MDWTVSPGFLAEVLAAFALVVFVPSGIATLVLVRDRRAGRSGPPARAFVAVSYLLSAIVIAALVTFLLVNHVRVADIRAVAPPLRSD